MEIDRMRRVGELMQRELALIINSDLSDPRIGLLTVTDVKVTKDMRNARVFITEFSGKTSHAELIAVLSSAAGYLRRQLSQRLSLRTTPQLHFVYDESLEHGFKITNLINQAIKKDN